MKKYTILICFLSSVICSLFLTHDVYAFWGREKKQAPKAAIEVTEAANQRLKARLEELSKGNEVLKSKIAGLDAEINSLNQDRNQILDKLKIITEENSKLKAMILYLQTGVLNMGDLRKQMTDDRRQMTERIAELEKETQPVRKVKEELNKKIEELKEEVKEQKTEVGKQKTEDRKQRTEILRLERELKAAQRKEESLLREIEKEKAIFEKEKEELEKEIDDLKKQITEDRKQRTEERSEMQKKVSELDKSLNDTLGEFSGAQRELKRLKRENADMHYNLGVIFQQQAKWREAVREYEKVLEIKPDDADANFNLAIIYDTIKNDREKAVFYYKRYLDITPEADDALKVKEYITGLNTKNAVWGEPGMKNIREKKGRW